jgi:hypothetical protein
MNADWHLHGKRLTCAGALAFLCCPSCRPAIPSSGAGAERLPQAAAATDRAADLATFVWTASASSWATCRSRDRGA